MLRRGEDPPGSKGFGRGVPGEGPLGGVGAKATTSAPALALLARYRPASAREVEPANSGFARPGPGE